MVAQGPPTCHQIKSVGDCHEDEGWAMAQRVTTDMDKVSTGMKHCCDFPDPPLNGSVFH